MANLFKHYTPDLEEKLDLLDSLESFVPEIIAKSKEVLKVDDDEDLINAYAAKVMILIKADLIELNERKNEKTN